MFTMFKGKVTTQAEQEGYNKQLDNYCGKVAESCATRFPAPPLPIADVIDPFFPPPAPPPEASAKEGEEDFMKKYKYPLIAGAIVLLALILTRKPRGTQPIIIKK